MKHLGIDRKTAMELMKEADSDGDTKLSPEEYQGLESTAMEQHGQQRLLQDHDEKAQKMFSRMDTDESGLIDRKKEFQKVIQMGMKYLGIDRKTAMELMKEADSDGDNKLSPEEYQGLESTAMEQHGQQRLLQDHDEKAQKRFSRMDTDESGLIDRKKEFQKVIQMGMKHLGIDRKTAMELMKEADSDGDNKLSPEEYQGLESTAMEQHGQQRLLQ